MNECKPDPKQVKKKRKTKIDYSGFAHKKAQPMRSETYKKFVRSLPCIVCGNASEHSHEPLNKYSHGTAMKGPDNESLPLCAFHHRFGPNNRHLIGQEPFYRMHGIDWRKYVVEYQKRFDKGVEETRVF